MGHSNSITRALSLNRTVGVVLVSVLFFGLGEELWSPFMPIYLQAQTHHALHADGSGAAVGWRVLWAIGIYAFLRNVFEGFCYIGGGQLTGRLGDRGSLTLFALLTIAGYIVFLTVPYPGAAIIAALLILGWEPLSVPVTFTTVGSTVAVGGQGMAFALQSIQKRLPKIIGPAIAGLVLAAAERLKGDADAGRISGMRVLVAGSLALGLISLAIQLRWMPHRKPLPAVSTGSFAIVRSFHPILQRLLIAEMFTRWCDWLVREFVVIYLISVRGVSVTQAGFLLAIQNLTALATYLPIGRLTRTISVQPFIGATFCFFAIFPLILALIPDGGWLVIAFVTYGLREVGEPARKAVITSLMPDNVRARGVGLYWGVRSFVLCWAAPVGAIVWYLLGPQALLYTAFGLGCMGGLVYFFFCRGIALPDEPVPAMQ
jgi:MFS family permease